MSSNRSVPSGGTEATRQQSQENRTAPPAVFPLVAVGAGDAKALRQFFAALPVNSGLAYLIIAPLLAEEDLASLLRAWTPLPLHVADGPTVLAPDEVVLVPPLYQVTEIDASLVVQLSLRGELATIDAGFRAAARRFGSRALGVLLAGIGTDGALGLAHIRYADGLTALQQPDGANPHVPPAPALAVTPVDLVLPADALPIAICRYAAQFSDFVGDLAQGDIAPTLRTACERAMQSLRKHTSYDFSAMQPALVLHKLHRRRQLHDLANLDDYVQHVVRDTAEAGMLLRDLLAGSREFFREPSMFGAMAESIVPPLFQGKNGSDQVRVWVIGSGAGEEAYSIAMLLLEHMDNLADPPDLRIFATDLNPEALRNAREGLYLETIAAEIDPLRLLRFFTRDGKWRRINSAVRQRIVFAQHNILKDPPFSKLDLVICRDVLAKLVPQEQARLVGILHASVNPQSYLCLGAGETLDTDYFSRTVPEWPFYQRLLVTSPEWFLLGAAQRKPFTPAAVARQAEGAYTALFADQVQQYTPPGLLVDEHYAIVYYSEGVSPFLYQPGGVNTEHVMERVHPQLREHVVAAVVAAFKLGQGTHTAPLELDVDGRRRYIRLLVRPVDQSPSKRLALVLFIDSESSADAVPERSSDALIGKLQNEITALHDQLRMVTEEYAVMNEEIKSANAELLSLNEELQLKAFELQKSKEELQSANQELLVINVENHRNIGELRRISANLQNLIIASDIATLFLDKELRIRWFTPSVASLFNLLPEDEGRPFWHLTHQLAHSGLNELALDALQTLKTHEFEVKSESGAWYFARMLPYRTTEGAIDGLVFTFVDITGRKRAEDALRDLNAKLEQRVGERTLELERSNRELDQFAYVASHDLKSPLRAITNLANWIHEDAAAMLPSSSLTHLEKLRSRIARMERLLDDLLAYSRAGRHLHKPESVDTAELVRGIQFFLELPPGFRVQIEHPMPQLFTERVPLETVLRNLVSNAVKHHDRPSEGFVRVSAEEQGDWVQFSVLDNGPGIAPQHHERVFQIFQSLKPRDQVEGSGMGLAVVKKTVESQGGRIELISDKGQGAIFRFTWPKLSEDPTS